MKDGEFEALVASMTTQQLYRFVARVADLPPRPRRLRPLPYLATRDGVVLEETDTLQLSYALHRIGQ